MSALQLPIQPKANIMKETDAKIAADVAALIAAPALFTQYAIATLIIAMAEKGVIDPARVFAFFRPIVDGFEGGLVKPLETARMAAELLRGVEKTFWNMVTIPPGAGRA